MSVEQELNEHAGHAQGPFDKRVAATMAALAAMLAVISVLGHMATTEEIILQQKASDQWSYYQAKSIRRYESEIARDLLMSVKGDKVEEYRGNAERYKKEGEEIQTKAREFEEVSHHKGLVAVRFEFGEVFVEVAIVLASLAILSKRNEVWVASLLSGGLGIAIAATSLTIH